MRHPPAANPASRSGHRPRPAAGVADPSRGTQVAIGIPVAAAIATGLWMAGSAPVLDTSLPIAIGLMMVAAAAAQIVVQLGPRSWYTPATPVVVLSALVGGPLLGVLTGVSTQLIRPKAVWRQRSAEGGLAVLQGLVAGMAGASLLAAGNVTAAATVAMLAAVATNSIGRMLILLERRARPLVAIWRRGLFVDLLETLLTVPLLSVLLIAADENAPLAVIAMATLLAALLIAQRSRATTDLLIAQRSQATTEAALAAERANARHDQLTGARNRRAFEEAMVAEHARIVRGATAAGLFVVDLDRFKFVNDRFGHSVGDEVLIEVFRRLGDGLRPADVVARWGGEEIAILAPAVRTGKQLEQFGERIRMLIGGCPIATSTMAISLTASVGGTLLDGSVPAETAFQQADGALYEAKRTRDTSVTTLPPPLGLRLETG